MDRCLKYAFIVKVAIFLFLGQVLSFADQPDAPKNSLEIISPASVQSQQSSQKATVSASNLISLDYVNADLTDVLKAIAYSYNINIIISKELQGKISAKLNNFSLDDALNAILDIHNYGFMRKGGIVYVMPKDDLDQVTETLPLSFLTLKEAKSLLTGAKSKFKGTIQDNEDNNALVVTANPADMALIKNYLKGIDVPPIQVMIDARIVNIDKKYSKDIGSTISVSYTPSTGMGVSLLSGDTATPAGPNTSLTSSNSSGSSTTAPSAASTSTIVGSGSDGSIFGMSGNWRHVSPTIAINALITQNKARVIASPSIATLNGHEASILIGDHYPYVSSTSTAGGTGGSVVNQSSVSYVDVGTKLKVTPIVSPDGWITLTVEPEVSSVINTIQGNPEIATSTAKTEVRVKDNETIVIGGLDSRNENSGTNGTPGLMNIPILGWLFHHNTSTMDDGTLTVLITPHIVSMSPAASFINTKTASLKSSFSKGEDANVIRGLLDYASSLEQDKSKDLAKNLYISEEQIKTYRKILEQFPQSGKTDFCLYKIAFIYGKDFGNCVAAKEALTEMKDFFPHSPYVKVTELFVNACIAVGDRGNNK
ncbi:MAG: secretin and TonB N-terminal domain-containing protein [Candidatus Omnitrophica bacterium]|nr:secretin and TonB N-terminal domain-containing protein [Candidatus Omnitrophota bacterium]